MFTACGGQQPDTDVLTDTDTEPDLDLHPCDAEAARTLAWTPQDLAACFEGHADGEGDGWDAGRLVCILGGDYCPACVGDGGGSWTAPYRFGYLAGYGESYKAGYQSEGCEP
jgi:hypothetical protein